MRNVIFPILLSITTADCNNKSSFYSSGKDSILCQKDGIVYTYVIEDDEYIRLNSLMPQVSAEFVINGFIFHINMDTMVQHNLQTGIILRNAELNKFIRQQDLLNSLMTVKNVITPYGRDSFVMTIISGNSNQLFDTIRVYSFSEITNIDLNPELVIIRNKIQLNHLTNPALIELTDPIRTDQNSYFVRTFSVEPHSNRLFFVDSLNSDNVETLKLNNYIPYLGKWYRLTTETVNGQIMVLLAGIYDHISEHKIQTPWKDWDSGFFHYQVSGEKLYIFNSEGRCVEIKTGKCFQLKPEYSVPYTF